MREYKETAAFGADEIIRRRRDRANRMRKLSETAQSSADVSPDEKDLGAAESKENAARKNKVPAAQIEPEQKRDGNSENTDAGRKEVGARPETKTEKLPKIDKSSALGKEADAAEREGETPLIEFDDIYKIYQMGDTEVHAIDGISMKIYKGEFVAIVGQSGSGKSTCMNIIGCLDVPTRGRYFLEGKDVSKMKDDEQAEIRNKKLGFIFQQYNLIPKINVLENVKLPLMYAGMSEKEQERRARESLAKVGLESKAKNMPQQLSGGQQQRVSIARALAGDPSIILADEPTGALDSRTGKEVLDFLKKLHKTGNTIVLITHDNTIAAQAGRVIKVSDGRIEYDGEPDIRKFATIAHAGDEED